MSDGIIHHRYLDTGVLTLGKKKKSYLLWRSKNNSLQPDPEHLYTQEEWKSEGQAVPLMMDDLSSKMAQRTQFSLSNLWNVCEFPSQQWKNAFIAPLRLWIFMQILQVCGFSLWHVTPPTSQGHTALHLCCFRPAISPKQFLTYALLKLPSPYPIAFRQQHFLSFCPVWIIESQNRKQHLHFTELSVMICNRSLICPILERKNICPGSWNLSSLHLQ